MNPKTKRILSIIALVFVGIATVFFVAYLALMNRQPWYGITGAVTVTSFIIGGGLWGIVAAFHKRDLKAEQKQKEIEDDLRESNNNNIDDDSI